jgi:hypothetical protein
MKIKSLEWIDFKTQFMNMLSILGDESERFDIPEESDNFIIQVDGCQVNPIFLKKVDLLKVEYDMSLCNTSIRTLSFSIYKDAGRIEMTLKNEDKINKNL